MDEFIEFSIAGIKWNTYGYFSFIQENKHTLLWIYTPGLVYQSCLKR